MFPTFSLLYLPDTTTLLRLVVRARVEGGLEARQVLRLFAPIDTLTANKTRRRQKTLCG